MRRPTPLVRLLVPSMAVLAALSARPVAASDAIVSLARQYVEAQTRGLGDEVVVTVPPLGPNTRVGECPRPEVYTPRGSRLWGKTRVSVRCTHPTTWLIHVPVEVKVSGHYLSTAIRMKAGHVVSDPDIRLARGELTVLPEDVLIRPEQARGQTVRVAVEAERPLRKDHLQRELLVRQGQAVRIVVRQPAFTVSSDGTALANGYAGDMVRVKSPSGRVVQGKVTAEGAVEVRP